MKKFILALTALIISSGCAFAQKYRGFFDLSYSYSLPKSGETDLEAYQRSYYGLSTSHGVQIKKFFVGVGLEGLTNLSDGVDIPVFADVRYDFFGRKTTNFFVGCKLGAYVYSNGLYFDYPGYNDGKATGLYFKPSIGVRFRLSPVVGINLALFYSPMNVKFPEAVWTSDGYLEYSHKTVFINRLGLSIGLDF
ncbi:MAG: hypothetical protein K2L14_01420 [Duncaniella sp.]|nr:hypothetical protein [Duncaniella sp.]